MQNRKETLKLARRKEKRKLNNPAAIFSIARILVFSLHLVVSS